MQTQVGDGECSGLLAKTRTMIVRGSIRICMDTAGVCWVAVVASRVLREGRDVLANVMHRSSDGVGRRSKTCRRVASRSRPPRKCNIAHFTQSQVSLKRWSSPQHLRREQPKYLVTRETQRDSSPSPLSLPSLRWSTPLRVPCVAQCPLVSKSFA